MKLTLVSLEAFCAAVEERSISGAARRIYLSQPSVSEKLAELEREAEVPLLKRSRQGVVPTLQGTLLYERARKILSEVATLEHTLHALHAQHDSNLRLGSCLTLGEYLLPEWLQGFREETPETVPKLLMGNNQEVIQAVKNGDMAIGLVASEEYLEGLETFSLIDDEYMVVVAPDHPWTRREISPKDLCEEAYISREKGARTKEIVEHSLEEMGEGSLNVQMELGSITAVKEAIERGMGFSILSRAAIRGEVEAGKLTVARGFTIPVGYVAIWLPDALLTSVERAFCAYLTESVLR